MSPSDHSSSDSGINWHQKYLLGLEELVALHRDVGSITKEIQTKKKSISELKDRMASLETIVADLQKKPKIKAASAKMPASSATKKLASKSKSNIDNPSQKTLVIESDQEKLGLVLWSDIIEKHYPNTIPQLTSTEISKLQSAVHEFLRVKLKSSGVQRCRLPEGDGIPKKFLDSFLIWIKSQMKSGILERVHNNKDRAAASLPSVKRRKVLNALKPMKTKETLETPSWKTWVATLREVIPSYRVESLHSHFVKGFLNQHMDPIQGKDGNTSSGHLAIPEDLKELFLKEFFVKFPRLRPADDDDSTDADTPRGSIIVDSGIENVDPNDIVEEVLDSCPTKPGITVSSWVDICQALFPREMDLIKSDEEYERRIRTAVGRFLQTRVSELGMTVNDCIDKPNSGGRRTFAIPLPLEAQFISWFRAQLKRGHTGFLKDQEGATNDILESSTEITHRRRRVNVLDIDSDPEPEEAPVPPVVDSAVINDLLSQLCQLPADSSVVDTMAIDTARDSNMNGVIDDIFAPNETANPPSPLWSFTWLPESQSNPPAMAVQTTLPSMDTLQQDTPITIQQMDDLFGSPAGSEIITSSAENSPKVVLPAPALSSRRLSFQITESLSGAVSALKESPLVIDEPVTTSASEQTVVQTDEAQVDRSRSEAAASEPVGDAMDKEDAIKETSGVPEPMPMQLESPTPAYVEPSPVASASVEPVSLEPAPVELVSVEPASVELVLVEPAPEEPLKLPNQSEDTQKDCHGRTLVRYNSILLKLMPTYAQLSRLTRSKLKDLVKAFLVDKMGAADALSCTMTLRNGAKFITTLGIPEELEPEFRWKAVTHLRAEYGLSKVPFKVWEFEKNSMIPEPIAPDVQARLTELVEALMRSMRRFMRIRTLYLHGQEIAKSQHGAGDATSNDPEVGSAGNMESPQLDEELEDAIVVDLIETPVGSPVTPESSNVVKTPDQVISSVEAPQSIEESQDVIIVDSPTRPSESPVTSELPKATKTPDQVIRSLFDSDRDEPVMPVKSTPLFQDPTGTDQDSPIRESDSPVFTLASLSKGSAGHRDHKKSKKRRRLTVSSPLGTPETSLDRPFKKRKSSSKRQIAFSYDSLAPASPMSQDERPYEPIDTSDITRYTRLVLQLMPTFDKTPSGHRLQVKERVREFLLTRLGPRRFKDCVTWARSPSGHLFATLGIPRVLEEEFNSWAHGMLEGVYGSSLIE